MERVAISDWRTWKVAQINENLPLMITIEGVDAFLIDRPENIIVVSDLHPRVRNNLKALEYRARAGMAGFQPTTSPVQVQA